MQTWLVLGASSDLAYALFEKLNRSNDLITVYAQYNSHNVATDFDNLNIIPVKMNLSSKEEVDSFIKMVRDENIVFSHIVHMAAMPVEYIKLKKWNRERLLKELEVSVGAFANICSDVIPTMAKNGGGKVIVILTSYIDDIIPPKFMPTYIISKYALRGFVRCITSEYGDKGIDVVEICPSMMETKFLDNIDPRIIEMDAMKMPNGRHITTKEVAEEIICKITG